MASGYKLPDTQVQIDYAPQGATLKDFHKVREDYHHRILIGPLGSGKTQACIAECLQMIDEQEPRPETTKDPYGNLVQMPVRRSRGVIARNTYTDLQNTTIKDWREWTDELPVGKFVDGNAGKSPTWNCEYFKGDGTKVIAEVVFLAFDVEKDIRKARGIQATWVWCNEIKEMARAIVNMLFGRTGRYPARSRQMMIGDSNAPDRDHWLGQLALKVKPEGWWFGIQPAGVIQVAGKWKPNPAAENIDNLPKNYYYNQVAGARESYIRSNLANEFVFFSDGRPVHRSFNERLHTADLEPTPGIPIVVGVDFGRTPAAAIMQPQENGQWYVLKEVVTVNTNALDFGRSLKRVLNEFYNGYMVSIWGDPAGDQMAQTRDETPFDMLALAGLEAYPCHTNDFEERITALDEKLERLVDGQPAILVDAECTMLIKGLAGGYKYKRIQVSGDDRYQDKPDKTMESHVCEALHYGLLGAGEGVTMFDQEEIYEGVDEWHPTHARFE